MRSIVAVLLLGLSFSGCNCASEVDVKDSCSASAPCPSGYKCISAFCEKVSDGGKADGGGDAGRSDAGVRDAGMSARITSIVLEPPTATLLSSNGSKPTQTFAVRATLSDGNSMLVDNAIFSGDNQPIGTIDGLTGIFTASAQVGGLVNIRAEVIAGSQTLAATGTVTVRLAWVVQGTGVTATDVAHFNTPGVVDAAREVGVVYPLDNVVFPQNVAPADVQWLKGNVGDVMRITIVKPNVVVTAYASELGDKHWLADTQAWRAIAQTDPNQLAQLTVDRFDAASSQVITGTAHPMRFARAALSGSVYYWDIAAGRIVRIDDGTTNRTNFMPNPPPAVGGERCVGCHTVSASGRYMSGRLGGADNIGGIFDLTTDLTPDPAPTVWPTGPSTQRWWFSSFNPDATRLVVSTKEGAVGQMAFLNPMTGGLVAVSGTPNDRITHVVWSPDGQTIAYVNNVSGWGGDSTTGDLMVVPVTGPDALGTPRVIHTGAALAGSIPAGSADSYPTWSPDSLKLAFANGTGNRSESHEAALYWMQPDGGSLQRLTNASGGPTGTTSFQPRFSPFIADGYYWMSFLSRRDYGNDKVGTRGASRQQVWVAAVKVNGPTGQDPSEVGYWLPGQNTQSKNIAAFWAPRACRKQAESCAVGSECCSGLCAANAMGTLVCSPTPADRCRVQGETCGAASDCCVNKGLVCKANTCLVDIN